MPAAKQPSRAPAPLGETTRIAVLGLGYVGLPLAIAFGRRYETLGFDIDARRILALGRGEDASGETTTDDIRAASRLAFSDQADDLRGSDVFVVTVPTPVDADKRPDLSALEAASRTVGGLIAPGNVAIFESTVYPGATEETCVPILESESGLSCNRDFFVGYSPERINPGDESHRLQDVVKITSGSTPAAAAFVDALYASVVPAGTHRAADIRTAEAAKMIENVQRDLNIALVNEFAMIFDRLGLDTQAVLEAAGSKWNFLPFRPGLVGGHCIGVDPYYLAAKAEAAGHRPELVKAARRVNNGMAGFVAERVVALMAERAIAVAGARILILGLAYKANCPDVRNSQAFELAAALRGRGATVDIRDPCVTDAGGEALVAAPQPGSYDAVVVAVGHDAFREMGPKRIRALGKERSVLYDVAQLLPASAVDGRL